MAYLKSHRLLGKDDYDVKLLRPDEVRTFTNYGAFEASKGEQK